MYLFLHFEHFSFTDVRETAFLQADEGGNFFCQLSSPFFATICAGVFNSWLTNFSGSRGVTTGGVGSSTLMATWSVLIEGVAACSCGNQNV